MTLAEGIDRLQRQTPGCRALVFGDLHTRTVLRSAATPDLRQEDHDAVLADAAVFLGAPGAALLARAAGTGAGAGSGEGSGPDRALRLLPGEARLYRRVSPGAAEVVCARLAGDPDLAAFDRALSELLGAHG